MILFSSLLSRFPTGAGLMDIKSAWNADNLQAIISIWLIDSSEDYITLMTLVNNIDFIFMISYSAALFSSLILAGRKINRKPRLQMLLLYGSVICAGGSFLFDFIEGLFIIRMLGDPTHITNFIAFGASFVAFVTMIEKLDSFFEHQYHNGKEYPA
jgi:hypothetical protein